MNECIKPLVDGFAGAFAECLCGSPGLYAAGGRKPHHSVNFITAHDGFTLRDLVSYNDKNNLANGEAGGSLRTRTRPRLEHDLP